MRIELAEARLPRPSIPAFPANSSSSGDRPPAWLQALIAEIRSPVAPNINTPPRIEMEENAEFPPLPSPATQRSATRLHATHRPAVQPSTKLSSQGRKPKATRAKKPVSSSGETDAPAPPTLQSVTPQLCTPQPSATQEEGWTVVEKKKKSKGQKKAAKGGPKRITEPTQRGAKVVETGDEPAACAGRRTLVLANHQSTADVPMLMAAWNPRPGVLPNLMWIMDRVFKFTNFGIVSVLHEDFFIQAGKAKREQSLVDLRQHIRKFYMPLSRQFMVLFPEGGFLHKRREVSQRFAEKNNLPKLEYVSLPRAGAMKVIMEEIGPNREEGASTSKDDTNKDSNFNQSKQVFIVDNKVGDSIEWILDVTIAYPDRIPIHLQDVVCGTRPPCTTHLHYRLYPSSEVPSDTEGMTQWLYDRFIEKDKMLEEFYKTGKFPSKETSSQVVRQVRQDNLRYLILHIFFIASSLVQYKMLSAAFSYLW
ncbi:hypothetical protein K1T71_008119 [Dendrolimus kikuchii]|uniref:Uncharacterized protein n=1 Tax=Dendrolimus kikuchii TaxID=765133 RepID=A0ACC1CWL0_9NEOP|nr:hypothetical protein K1T71_008119 [Dendrolimus kikuchii]